MIQMNVAAPTLYGTRHAISAGHHLAAAAGFAILESGGNAVDAGCAAGIALGVLVPDLVNVAGVAPIMIRLADGKLETIAGLGHWPKNLPPDIFKKSGEIPSGVLRTVVPAAPDAWITALERHGTMRFAEIAAAAIKCAAEGFAVSPLLSQSIESHREQYQRYPSSAAIYLPGGKVPKTGDKFVQSDLARTLQYMADQDRAAPDRMAGLKAAHDAFYRGDIAHAIAAHQKSEGGYLSLEDLSTFRSRIEPAVVRRWRGHEIAVCGAWCQGPTLLEALLILEQIGFEGLTHNSPGYLHRLTEAIKLAMSDRERYFGDPRFIDVPIDYLLSAETIVARARLFDENTAFHEMPPAADGTVMSGSKGKAGAPKGDPDTTYVCVVDRWGNAFSATPSDGSWESPVTPGLGLIPSNRGSQSRPDPSHPAGVAPGKRPRLTPNPAMAILADGGVMPFGTPGGDVQVQAMLQVLLNVLHFDLKLQEAVEAPRVASYSFPSSFAPFDVYPGRLAMENRISHETSQALSKLGHEILQWPDITWLAGCVEIIRTYPARGLVAAGADPRRSAYAIVS
jgi:gamma-glutamyltranspeptidase/glutathione hydrolase